MPPLLDRLRRSLAGSQLATLESQVTDLQGIAARLAEAYTAGSYELPPTELVRQLREYDTSLISDLVDQMGWEAVSGYGGYSEGERQRAVADSTRMAKYSTLAKWTINLWTFYGLSSNVDIVPDDDSRDAEDSHSAQSVWTEFWDADRNQAIIAKDRLDELSRWLLIKGERFFAFYSSQMDGETTIRSIRPEEVTEIYTNPDDSSDIWFYKRQWTDAAGKSQTLVYPDWEIFFSDKLAQYWTLTQSTYSTARGLDLASKPQTDVCLLFVPFTQLDEDSVRGWPLLAPHGTAWLRAQRDFMQDRAAVTRSVAAFVRRYKVSGGTRAVDSIRSTLMSALQSGSTTESNYPPIAGSSEILNRAIDAQDLPLQTGAIDAKTDSEMFAWFALLAGGIYPHYGGQGDAFRLATACYSADTMYLSEFGWRHWFDYREGERIATYDSATGTIHYVAPTRLHIYPYEGKMIRIKARSIDALVTPNHRMLAINENWRTYKEEYRRTEFEVILAENLPSDFSLPTKAFLSEQPEIKTFMLPGHQANAGTTGISFPDRFIPMDDWLEFIGWYVSDGSLSRTRGGGMQLRLHQKKQQGVKQIDDLVARLPFKFTRSLDKTTEGISWSSYDRALYTWVKSNCGKGAQNKHLPSFALRLNARQSKILLDAVWAGDGHLYNPEAQDHAIGKLSSTSQELLDQCQILLLHTGSWASQYWRQRTRKKSTLPEGALNWSDYDKKLLFRYRNVTEVDYQGLVWCFEAPPYGMFITRRNGCPLIAGNTAMEKPMQLQFSLYRNQLGAIFRKIVRIVLQFHERYNKQVKYDTYTASISLDRLVEVDLPVISSALTQINDSIIQPLIESNSLTQEARNTILASMLRLVFQTLGMEDASEIVNESIFTEPKEQIMPELEALEEPVESTQEEAAIPPTEEPTITDEDIENWLAWVEKLDPDLMALVLADEEEMREGDRNLVDILPIEETN